jgi:hypothetical protein
MKKQVLSDLVRLIRSMSKAEKRAFQLFSSRYKSADSSTKSYLKLYQQLSHYTEKDPLPNVKNADQEYLFSLLVHSLVQQGQSTPEIELRDQLSSVIILHRRGLEKKAHRILEKLLLAARETCTYEFGLEVVGLHMQLLTSVEDIGKVKSLVAERKKLLQALSVFQQYDELMVRLLEILQENNPAALQQFLRSALLKKNPKDIRSQVHRHHLLAHAGISLHDFKLAEKHHDAIQHLFEKNLPFLRQRTLPYLMIVLNSGIFAYHARKAERLKEAIVRLKQLPGIVGPLQIIDRDRILRYQLDLQLRSYLLGQHPESCLSLMGNVKQMLLNDQQMEPHRANYLRYFIALALYQCNQTKEALQWLQTIIDNRKQGYYNLKTYSLAFLLRAACHYKQNHDDTGDQLLLAFRRNKFFAPSRKQLQFQLLIREIPKGYNGENWLL